MKTALIYNSEIKNYSFGKGHPFTSERFESIINFAKEKLPDFKNIFKEIIPEPASEKDLKAVHSQKYIDVISRASKGIIIPNILKYSICRGMIFRLDQFPINCNPLGRDFKIVLFAFIDKKIDRIIVWSILHIIII